MAERSWSGDYRYGFQGQENESDLTNSCVTFSYRIEDARLGRFLSIDPLSAKFADNSPYAFSCNRPIDKIELEGAEVADADWESAQISKAYQSLWSQKTTLSTETYEYLNDALNEAWYSYTTFSLFGRDLSQRGMARYLGGEGGYDVYSYDAIEESSFLTFGSMNKDAQSLVMKTIMEKAEQLPTGTFYLEASSSVLREQSGALASDFGTAFGSAQVDCIARMTATVKEDGSFSYQGVLSYTFADTYQWHPNRGTEANMEDDIADHQQLSDLKNIGAKPYSVRSYYEQSVWGNNEVGMSENQCADTNADECPVVNGYYKLPEGSNCKHDYGKNK